MADRIDEGTGPLHGRADLGVDPARSGLDHAAAHLDLGVVNDLDRCVGHQGSGVLGGVDDVAGMEADDEVLTLGNKGHGPLDGIDAQATGSG